MIITYHKGQCFKVSFGDTTIAFDPISKNASLPAVKFGADVVFISSNHEDFNGVEQVTYGDRAPFVAHGAGAYEVGSVTAQGFMVREGEMLANTSSNTEEEKEEGVDEETTEKKIEKTPHKKGSTDIVRYTTIYRVNFEGMNIVFLGALGQAKIDTKILEELGDIDILFVPIGGERGEYTVLDAVEASKIAVKLEPKVVIPMYAYGSKATEEKEDKKQLEAFLKEGGGEVGDPVEKLTLKKKDVAEMEGEIIVLKA